MNSFLLFPILPTLNRGAEQATVESKFGIGAWQNSDILLDDVSCVGSESSIQTCHYEYESNCIPSEGAGVICKQNEGKTVILLLFFLYP